ncbi:hypothetical protein DAEQUDRAFT_55315 [Daedalea quercina L-15889]|uniref:Uncharacterized protein n=1 Tax=Daedalea quercina L-15889 TaxID=1314783 RepID=A0A165SJ56_9APHY|nr:hypothetical protein DAEQUDRAFT_55315 [Daedalea quercina L-15889]
MRTSDHGGPLSGGRKGIGGGSSFSEAPSWLRPSPHIIRPCTSYHFGFHTSAIPHSSTNDRGHHRIPIGATGLPHHRPSLRQSVFLSLGSVRRCTHALQQRLARSVCDITGCTLVSLDRQKTDTTDQLRAHGTSCISIVGHIIVGLQWRNVNRCQSMDWPFILHSIHRLCVTTSPTYPGRGDEGTDRKYQRAANIRSRSIWILLHSLKLRRYTRPRSSANHDLIGATSLCCRA